MRIAKKFSDNTAVGWGKGTFDDWCVYKIKADGTSEPPLDVDYFTELLSYGDRFGRKRVYNDFVKIYDAVVSKDPNECHIEIIDEIVATYPGDVQLPINKLFTILWMAMISEWNYMINGKYPTKLQHRIKRLGIYTMLIEGKTPEYSATFMKDNMSWQEINELCKVDNFEIKGTYSIDYPSQKRTN